MVLKINFQVQVSPGESTIVCGEFLLAGTVWTIKLFLQ